MQIWIPAVYDATLSFKIISNRANFVISASASYASLLTVPQTDVVQSARQAWQLRLNSIQRMIRTVRNRCQTWRSLYCTTVIRKQQRGPLAANPIKIQVCTYYVKYCWILCTIVVVNVRRISKSRDQHFFRDFNMYVLGFLDTFINYTYYMNPVFSAKSFIHLNVNFP